MGMTGEFSTGAMVEKLGAFRGGFIAGYYGGNEAIGVKPEWQDWACQAFVRYGTRRDGRRAGRRPRRFDGGRSSESPE